METWEASEICRRILEDHLQECRDCSQTDMFGMCARIKVELRNKWKELVPWNPRPRITLTKDEAIRVIR